MTHDYKRNGTTTLFAALEMASGKLIGQCMKRHRHQEWLKFLKLIDAETPPELDLHLIADNYSTHKHPKVKAWLAKHPRFHMHFIPTSSSWLNMVERWFARSRRSAFGVAASVASNNSKRRFKSSLTRTTMTPNRSFGPPISTTSCPKSCVPTRRWIRHRINETLH